MGFACYISCTWAPKNSLFISDNWFFPGWAMLISLKSMKSHAVYSKVWGFCKLTFYWESSLFTTELQDTDNWKEIKFMHAFKFDGFPEHWQGHH